MNDDPQNPQDHLRQQIVSMRALLALLSPFSAEARKMKAKVAEIEAEMERLTNAREAFARIYGPRGWPLFDHMSVDVMAEVVAMVPEEGDARLTQAHLDPDRLQFSGNRLKSARFRMWFDLYDRAVERAGAGDFLSCVPLTLMIIDGLVTKTTGKHAFSGGVDAPVFDTIASGPGGVADALRLQGQKRGGANDDEIANPLRHGILHGVDVNYGHAMVAAKAFATLHAVVNYCERQADEAERREKAREAQRVPGWGELTDSLRQSSQAKREVAEWKARPERTFRDDASDEETAEFGEKSPEAAAAAYLTALAKRNWGNLARATINYPRDEPIGPRAKDLRERFGGVTDLHWRILKIADVAPAVAEVDVRLWGAGDGQPWDHEGTIRLIQEDDNGAPIVHGLPGGTWKANNLFLGKLEATILLGLSARTPRRSRS